MKIMSDDEMEQNLKWLQGHIASKQNKIKQRCREQKSIYIKIDFCPFFFLFKMNLNKYFLFVYFVCPQGPGWEYETPLPEWAKVDWIDYDTEQMALINHFTRTSIT